MGGFFAGVSKTPLTSIVMVSEMTGSYSLLVPLMLACGLNMAISRRWTIYEEQVPTPIDSPAHQGDFVVDVLEQLSVGEVGVRTAGHRDGRRLHAVPRADPPGGPVDRDALPRGRPRRAGSRGSSRSATCGSPWSAPTGARWSWPTTWPIAPCSRSRPRTTCTRPCGG